MNQHLRFDRDALRETALDRAEDLFREVWGEPARPGAREWRPKRAGKGSGDDPRALVIRGPKAGLWHDKASGRGGDLFDLWAEHIGLSARSDFRAVATSLAAFLGHQGAMLSPAEAARERAAREARRAQRDAESARLDAERAAATRTALRRLIGAALPLADSRAAPARAYLAGRGLTAPEGAALFIPGGALPPFLRGLPAPDAPALLILCHDAAGAVVAAQRIILRPDGSDRDRERGKPMCGPAAAHPARLAARPDDSTGGALCLAEGFESALAVWSATGAETWVCFDAGGLARAMAAVPEDRRVIAAADRDAPGNPAQERIARAALDLGRRHGDAWLALAPLDLIPPPPEGGKDGADAADVIKAHGPDGVRAMIAAARPLALYDAKTRAHLARLHGARLKPAAAPRRAPALEPRIAGEALRKAIEGAFAEALAWQEGDKAAPPPVHVIRATVGLGKSAAARAALRKARALLEHGDIRIYAPTLPLADEWGAAMRKEGLGPRVLRGRGAINPATGAPMCERPEEAERIGRLGLSPQAKICSTRRRNAETGESETITCPFFASCAYQAQRQRPEGGELQLLAHEHLTLTAHDEGRPAALRIVDESFIDSLTRSVHIAPEALTQRRGLWTGRGGPALVDRLARLETLYPRLEEAAVILRIALERGENPVAALAARGFTEADMSAFAEAEAEQAADASIAPDMSAAEINAALDRFEAARGGREALKLRRMWLLLAEAWARGACERVTFERIKGEAGERGAIRLHWREAPHGDAPMIVIDADADDVVLRPLWPGLAFHRIDARLNVRVIQAYDTEAPKSRFTGGHDPNEAAEERAARGIAQERRIIQAAVADYGRGAVLYVNHKAAIRALFELQAQERGEAPPDDAGMIAGDLWGAKALWFGPGLRGLDGYKALDCVVIGSRYELPPHELEALGRAIFGDSGPPLRLLKDAPESETRTLVPYAGGAGEGFGVDVRLHPDPRIAALQRMAREQTTMQAVGRLRLVHRAKPATIINLSNIPLPDLPPDVLARRDELAAGRMASALLEAGAAQGKGGYADMLLTPEALAANAPETFRSAKAAKSWLEGLGELGPSPIREALHMAEGPNSAPLPEGLGRAARALLSGVWAPRSGCIVELRLEGARGRHGVQAYLSASDRDEALAQAISAWGELASFRVLHVIGPDEAEREEAHRAKEAASPPEDREPPTPEPALGPPPDLLRPAPTHPPPLLR